MPSNINVANPPFGNPTTAGVRANFVAAKAEIEQLQQHIGFANYSDNATGVTPIVVPINTWTKLTNDTVGAGTLLKLPTGVTLLWNPVNNELTFDELALNAMIDFRAELIINTSLANQMINFRTRLAISDASQFDLELGQRAFKVAGAHNLILNSSFFLGTLPAKNNPAEFQLFSDAAATVRVKGWYIKATAYLGN